MSAGGDDRGGLETFWGILGGLGALAWHSLLPPGGNHSPVLTHQVVQHPVALTWKSHGRGQWRGSRQGCAESPNRVPSGLLSAQPLFPGHCQPSAGKRPGWVPPITEPPSSIQTLFMPALPSSVLGIRAPVLSTSPQGPRSHPSEMHGLNGQPQVTCPDSSPWKATFPLPESGHLLPAWPESSAAQAYGAQTMGQTDEDHRTRVQS